MLKANLKALTPLVPPDLERCQAEKPGNGPFIIGGKIGDPKNGYRTRCSNRPTVIATEKKPGSDGRRGSMSICDECLPYLIRQMGKEYAELTPL
jgi:hypothetical protein